MFFLRGHLVTRLAFAWVLGVVLSLFSCQSGFAAPSGDAWPSNDLRCREILRRLQDRKGAREETARRFSVTLPSAHSSWKGIKLAGDGNRALAVAEDTPENTRKDTAKVSSTPPHVPSLPSTSSTESQRTTRGDGPESPPETPSLPPPSRALDGSPRNILEKLRENQPFRKVQAERFNIRLPSDRLGTARKNQGLSSLSMASISRLLDFLRNPEPIPAPGALPAEPAPVIAASTSVPGLPDQILAKMLAGRETRRALAEKLGIRLPGDRLLEQIAGRETDGMSPALIGKLQDFLRRPEMLAGKPSRAGESPPTDPLSAEPSPAADRLGQACRETPSPNTRGGWGFFETESAFLPEKKKIALGAGIEKDRYRRLNGTPGGIDGRQALFPLFLTCGGKRFSAGLVFPYQEWSVQPEHALRAPVKLSWYHDLQLALNAVLWKAADSRKAFALHLGSRSPSGGYHQPLSFFEGKSRVGNRAGPLNLGPAGATRGSWFESGGVYSWKIGNRWEHHLNLLWARDATDGISRMTCRAGSKFQTSKQLSIVSQLSCDDWRTTTDETGTNTDLLLGIVHQQRDLQLQIGFPLHFARGFGYEYEPIGVQMVVSATL